MKVQPDHPSAEDRATAARVAASINAYWRARGVDAKAQVGEDGEDGEIVSVFSSGGRKPARGATAKSATQRSQAGEKTPIKKTEGWADIVADRLARVERFVVNRGVSGATVKDVADALKINRQQAYTALRALIDDGFLHYVDRTAFPQRFRAAPASTKTGRRA